MAYVIPNVNALTHHFTISLTSKLLFFLTLHLNILSLFFLVIFFNYFSLSLYLSLPPSLNLSQPGLEASLPLSDILLSKPLWLELFKLITSNHSHSHNHSHHHQPQPQPPTTKNKNKTHDTNCSQNPPQKHHKTAAKTHHPSSLNLNLNPDLNPPTTQI